MPVVAAPTSLSTSQHSLLAQGVAFGRSTYVTEWLPRLLLWQNWAILIFRNRLPGSMVTEMLRGPCGEN